MINPVTCVCALLAAGSGLYLFQEKQQVQLLDRRIEQVLHAADAAHARTGMLRAEYALLNDPSRLEQLSRQHLPTLINTAPTQFASLVELDRRLPAVGSAPAAEPAPLEPTPPAPLPPVTVAPVTVAPVTVASVAVPPVRLAVPPATPRPVAAPIRAAFRATPSRVMPSVTAALPSAVTAAAPPATVAHASRTASRTTTQRSASRSPAVQRLALAARGDSYVTQPAAAAEPVQHIARGAPVDAGSPMVVGSALGMARSMLASGPVPSATAAAFSNGGPQSR